MGWSRKSYDAVHEWGDVRKREMIYKIMLTDGLAAEVERLRAAKTMGEWHKITMEAAAAVGPKVVEASAGAAERSLSKHASRGNAVYLSTDLVAQIGIEVAKRKAEGERASIKSYIEAAVRERLERYAEGGWQMIRHWYAVEEYTQTVYVFGQRAARDAWVGEHVDPSRELRYPILARNVPASAELVHTLPWQDVAYAAGGDR